MGRPLSAQALTPQDLNCRRNKQRENSPYQQSNTSDDDEFR